MADGHDKKDRTMKKFLILMVACGAALLARAQEKTDVLMATLQHGDEVSVYYGSTALEEAYKAAADSGDVVTLSAGRFSFSGYVQKSLSIVGNGFVSDMENGVYPTVIEGTLHFKPRDIVDDDGETIAEAVKVDGVRLEGLDLEQYALTFESSDIIRNVEITKCKLRNGIKFLTNTENFTLRQSLCLNTLSFNTGNSWYNHQNFYIVGCYVSSIWDAREHSTILMEHSIYNWTSIVNFSVSNSIVGSYHAAGGTVNNCIFINESPSNLVGSGNWTNCKFAGIFEESMDNLEWDDVKTFKLKYPDEYVGTDGTQVGLYGGPYPYNPTPSIPQIKESHIDTTVAADGKLKVSVTVEAQTTD